MSHHLKDSIDAACEIIKSADGLLIAAGAGMGVDSGMPDFRGKNGLWTGFKKSYPALSQLTFYDIASGSGFTKYPQLSWGFYGHRLNLYRELDPHAGYDILRKIGQGLKKSYFVFTSNVDGHFQKAKFVSSRIHECHGSIHMLQCNDDCHGKIWSAKNFRPKVDEKRCVILSEIPQCPFCKRAIVRPNILMFNDWTWCSAQADKERSCLDEWLASVKKPAIIELGAGTDIPTVRLFTEKMGRTFGGRAIRINPDFPAINSHYGVGIQSGALEALLAIEKKLEI